MSTNNHVETQSETVAPIATPVAAGTTALHELLTTMNGSWLALGQSFELLNEQSLRVASAGPTMSDSIVEIQKLRRQLRAQDKKQTLRAKEVKDTIKNLLKDQVVDEMRSHIQEQIGKEIALQVKEQMDAQIQEHLPIPLRQQTNEGRLEIINLRHALVNSEARRKNSMVDLRYEDDPLAVVMKPDGTRSDLDPADLRSLRAYDTYMMSALLKDHGLPELQSQDQNIKQFLCHIGIPAQTAQMTLDSDPLTI
ncbi:hypothetical protein BKA93DRAFT_756487 [Sparassis latifolia]